ncbi:CWC16 protein [Tribonema minus]|uniref:Splicing factor YJU2 n=1 Tax=Tribonema minus TaxID=303371 RepID=A0A835Z1Z4_9STRA|nr:CWC16 protein [Tribonema minus]
MGERKVLNKYFPPDFDPSKIPRMRRGKNHQVEVRMMLPFTIQCTVCSEFMYRGKKFNSKKEDCEGEDYKGIRKFRFYIKCITCNQEITFKTDPEHADYELEVGATRNFESWRETEAAETKAVAARAAEDKNDPMKALENRTLDSKIEMDILDALDEIRAVNKRHERVDTAAILESRARSQQQQDAAAALGGGSSGGGGGADDDEALIKSIKFGARTAGAAAVRRLSDSEGSGDEVGAGGKGGGMAAPVRLAAAAAGSDAAAAAVAAAAPVVIVKKRRKEDKVDKGEKKKKKKRAENGGSKEVLNAQNGGKEGESQVVQHADAQGGGDGSEGSGGGGLGGLLGAYGSDDSS